MKAIILYHPKSEHGGLVEDFAKEFERYKRKKIDLVSVETIEGADLAKLYGIIAYPAVLAKSDEGALQRLWQGGPLPLMDELAYYANSDNRPISHSGKLIISPVS